MQNITSIVELRNAIQILEVEHAINGTLLKEQCYLTYESFKPVSLLRGILNDMTSAPLLDNILGTAMGLATGYLTKRVVVNTSGNILKKLMGSMLQIGVANVVAQHPEAIKSVGQFLIQKILQKKE